MSKTTLFGERLKSAIEEKLFPRCSFVYFDDKEEIVKAFGTATYDQDSIYVTPDTLYDTASLTKIMTTMTLASLLIDEGILSLDDAVERYLPEYSISPEKQSSTILHLMTYTLNYNVPGGSKSLMSGLTPAQVANNALSFPLKEKPGTSYVYSNLTAFILTQVIEKVTGKCFDILVEEKIFAPLKMTTATFSPEEKQIPFIPPTEITEERGKVQGVVHDEFTYYTRRGGITNGAAGLFASIKDTTKFLRMAVNRGVIEDRVFISETLTSKWTQDLFPGLLPMHTPLAWGDLNNYIIDTYHRDIIVKAGFTGCFMLADLMQKRAFAILSNRTYPSRPVDSTSFTKLKEDLTNIALS
jgi:CubicO group peptidase (beta-lactamase class C family)